MVTTGESPLWLCIAYFARSDDSFHSALMGGIDRSARFFWLMWMPTPLYSSCQRRRPNDYLAREVEINVTESPPFGIFYFIFLAII